MSYRGYLILEYTEYGNYHYITRGVGILIGKKHNALETIYYLGGISDVYGLLTIHPK